MTITPASSGSMYSENIFFLVSRIILNGLRCSWCQIVGSEGPDRECVIQPGRDSCVHSRRNRKHIPSTLLILFVPIVIMTGCNGREIESHWAGGAITIDGDMSEWPDSTRTYLKKEKALVGISNDGENLYLLFRFGEPAWLPAAPP